MTNDVKTLIASLTTQRDALNRAIDGLKQLDAPVAQAQPVRRRGPRGRPLSMRTALVARLHGGETAASLMREYGVSRQTVYNWSRQLANGNGPVRAAGSWEKQS
jgi:hypothetical protein